MVTQNLWMKPDECGYEKGKAGFNYLIAKVGNNYYAIDDDYIDVKAGVSNYFEYLKVHESRLAVVKNKVRGLISLAELLGVEEKVHNKSVVLHLKESALNLNGSLSLIINNFPEIKTFEMEEISDISELENSGFGGFTIPDYIKKVIEKEEKLIYVMDLELLINRCVR
jgi:hypothetical protein